MNVSRLSSRVTQLVVVLTGAGFVLTLFFHKLILTALVAPEYQSVSPYLPWMLLSGGLFAAGQTISLNLMSQMRTRAMIAAKIVTAVLGTLFNCRRCVLARHRWSRDREQPVLHVCDFAWMMALARYEGGEKPLARTA